jgi:hypothetical protein
MIAGSRHRAGIGVDKPSNVACPQRQRHVAGTIISRQSPRSHARGISYKSGLLDEFSVGIADASRRSLETGVLGGFRCRWCFPSDERISA